jgi:hypothetical protein
LLPLLVQQRIQSTGMAEGPFMDVSSPKRSIQYLKQYLVLEAIQSYDEIIYPRKND